MNHVRHRATKLLRHVLDHRLYFSDRVQIELRVLAQEQGHNPIVAVAGCVAQQEGDALLKRSPGVADLIVGTQAIKRLPMLVEQAAATRRPA